MRAFGDIKRHLEEWHFRASVAKDWLLKDQFLAVKSGALNPRFQLLGGLRTLEYVLSGHDGQIEPFLLFPALDSVNTGITADAHRRFNQILGTYEDGVVCIHQQLFSASPLRLLLLF